MAKPQTIARVLATLTPLSAVQVCYRTWGGKPRLTTGTEFLRRYDKWRQRRSTVFV